MWKWLRGSEPPSKAHGTAVEPPVVVRDVTDAPDWSDGRTFSPLHVADGNPRLLLTVAPMEVDGRIQQAISIDHWNLDTALVEDLYLQALPTIRAYQRQLRGESDAQPARMDAATTPAS